MPLLRLRRAGLALALAMTAALSASATAAGAGGARLDRTGLVSTFRDEFDGPLREKVWRAADLRPDSLRGRTHENNGEKQIYVERSFRGTAKAPLGLHPFRVRDGVLEILAERAPAAARPHLFGYEYVAGEITTRSSFSQTYGYFEIRAKIPAGQGLWPAFWLLPADGAWPPEIDVFEILGREPNVLYTTVHTKAGGKRATHGHPTRTVDLSRDFHVYGVDWGAKEIVFYLDDREVFRTPTPADLHRPCYLIANLALGGGWAGDPDATTPFPAKLEIDWIRVWRRAR